MASESRKSKAHCVTLYGADARTRLVELEESVDTDREDFSAPKEQSQKMGNEGEKSSSTREKPKCCSIQAEPCAWLDFLTALLFSGYCVFLIWLLAYTKDNLYYHFLNLVPFFFIVLWSVLPCCYDKRVSTLYHQLRMMGLVAVVMSTFTMLTRVAFYHLTDKHTIGTNFVVVSLKASIAVFLWAMLARKRLSLIAIKADKNIIVQVILDNVDIFNLVEILWWDSDIGLGELIPEESPLEKTIQTFCTLAFVVLWIQAASLGTTLDELTASIGLTGETFSRIRRIYEIIVHCLSLLFHNVPFLVVRIFVWVHFHKYNIGFITKNVMAIIFSIGEIRYLALTGYDLQIQY